MGKRHIHRLRRIDIGRDKHYWVMKCHKDNCTHYTPMKTKLSAPQLRGTISECNRCGEEFVLDRRALRMEHPCCIECVKTKKDVRIKKKSAEDFFSELERDLANDFGRT